MPAFARFRAQSPLGDKTVGGPVEPATRKFVVATVVALLTVGAAPITAGVAAAAGGGVRCGQTVTASIRLTKDLGPCAGDGLVVTKNGVTVDLGGHTLRGDGDPVNTADQVGIRLSNVTTVSVQNGTVRDFNAGIAIEGGSRNTVTDMTVTNNTGTGTSLHGDGVVLDATTNNRIRHAAITHNGPFDGVLMTHAATNNRVLASSVNDNNILSVIPGTADTQVDWGFNIDSGSSGNVIDGNQVLRNGALGIAPVGPDVTGTRITNNVVRANGAFGIVAGGLGGQFISGNVVDHNGYDQFRPAGTEAGTAGGVAACGSCLGAGGFTTIQKNVITNNNGIGVSLQFNGFLFNGEFTAPHPNLIQENVVRDNTGDGIFVSCPQTFDTTLHCIAPKQLPNYQGLRILNNNTGGNGGAGAGTTAFDLHDGAVNCDHNTWRGNTYDTATPACTKRQ
jgi:hypothetical protein